MASETFWGAAGANYFTRVRRRRDSAIMEFRPALDDTRRHGRGIINTLAEIADAVRKKLAQFQRNVAGAI